MHPALRFAAALATALALAAAPRLDAQQPAAGATPARRQTYVLVHGAWGGSWAFRTLDSLLSASGHLVARPSLTGLGERVHLARADIDLSTHITDVVNAILFDDLRDVVLVGHSYGGMVVSGVAERIPERIRHLVYIDAIVPEDGESLVTAASGPRSRVGAARMVELARDGMLVPPWVRPDQPPPKDVPHPVRTFTETLALKNPAARRLPATYILTVERGKSEAEDDFAPFSARAKARGWTHHVLTADHTPERSAPVALAELLRGVP